MIILNCNNCGSDNVVHDYATYYSVWLVCKDCGHKFRLENANWKAI